MEDINAMLSSGEVPNLFDADELQEIREQITPDAKLEGVLETHQALFQFFLDRVRSNLRLIVCMSPTGDAFRNRLRMFPALVNCTTIDWFSSWPTDALREVARRFLADAEITVEETTSNETGRTAVLDGLVETVVGAHASAVRLASQMEFELKRTTYVTSTAFISLVSGFKKLLCEKRAELSSALVKFRTGVDKIDDTQKTVERLRADLELFQAEVERATRESEEFLVTLVSQKREADEQQIAVGKLAEKLQEEEAAVQAIAATAQAELDEATPVHFHYPIITHV